MTTLAPGDALTPMEAAYRAQCSLGYLYRQLRDGSLEGTRTDKGWRVSAGQLEEWIAARAAARQAAEASRQDYPDEVIDELAGEFLAEAQRRGKLPPQPGKPLLARIARAIRTADVA